MADKTAQENYDRYRYGVTRGHREFTEQAAVCERMYLGGGRQWDADDLAILKAQRRPAYEFNEVMPAVNSAVGYQIHNRMDITFRPRGGDADQERADIRSKVVMQIADQCRLHWRETEVFSDGLIQQRGYFDVRVEFTTNMQGNITVSVPDPMDVIPDPDAKTYDPEGWSDVIVTRWLTLDDIEADFGKAKRVKVENSKQTDNDWGEADDDGAERPKFGNSNDTAKYDATYLDGKIQRIRVIDRQKWVRTMTKCLYYPRSGDLKNVEGMSEVVVAAQQAAHGAIPTRAPQKRVRWTVTTCDVELHDDWSPYQSFTIVPFFPYFRRGQTVGMVDNAIGPQHALNKAISQFVHVVNTSANSGWAVEENSLTNMTTDDLEHRGAMTGLVLEYKKGSTPPEKIQPNQVPNGLDRLIDRAGAALKSVTVPDAMRGTAGRAESGVGIQSEQFSAQQQLALPIDNLARTRHMLATKFNQLTQQFYTEERTFRITETDLMTGKPKETAITVNRFDPETGTYENDLTEGEYDVVISEQPMQVTFQNGQFQQALELRKAGVGVPDTVMVQHSTLSRKAEIVDEMRANSSAVDPEKEAKAELIKAQMRKVAVEAVNKAVEGMFSATQAAGQIAMNPAIAPLADKLLHSAGFEDMDMAPIVPTPAEGIPAMPMQENTNPLTPLNPGVGAKAGIESGVIDLTQ